MSKQIRCDLCGRKRARALIESLNTFNTCKDRKECHDYCKEGVYIEVAQEVIDMIVAGLIHAECANCKDSECLVIWSSDSVEQIGTHLRNRLHYAK